MCFLLEYENLTRDYDKSKSVIEKEGIPNFYVKCLADLEDYIQKVTVQFLAVGGTRRNNQVVGQMSCRPLRLYIKGNYSVFEALFFCSVLTWLICHHCFETTFCRISFFFCVLFRNRLSFSWFLGYGFIAPQLRFCYCPVLFLRIFAILVCRC